ncbi:MAG: LLM class flavin-dependent oxidoreductase [Caulobacterales bacterium]|nr:LLM class flavin-dependent oxidoreductase [Caulobacterales bacterium]
MKCGVAVVAMNSTDWDRVNAGDWSRPPAIPDHQILDDAIAVGDLVEPLGFDSLWSSEHFATPYGMVPSSLQFLAFWAGRTKKIDLGSLVVVLPWWHPVKVAHEIAMLDILLQGRNFTLGVGRGLSPKEFGPLGVPQEESRQRFNEALEVIKRGFAEERFSYDGEVFKIPEMSIRPQPRHRDLASRAVGAFMTPASLEAIAKAGLGHIVVTAASFDQVGRNTALFNKHRQDVGLPPDNQPILYLFCYCSEDRAELEAAKRFAALPDGNYHYGFSDPSTFTNVKGYEAYGHMAAARAGPGAGDGDAAAYQWLLGTPDEMIEKCRALQRHTSAKEIVLAFNYGGMTQAQAIASMRLFAEKVLPALHAMETPIHHEALAPVA